MHSSGLVITSVAVVSVTLVVARIAMAYLRWLRPRSIADEIRADHAGRVMARERLTHRIGR